MKKFLNHNPSTVALVCMGPSCTDLLAETLTQEYAPSHADEVWCINMAANAFHADVIFWLDDLRSQYEFKPALMDALRKRGKPVITSVRRPDIVPNSYDFPLEEICRMPLGPAGVSVIDIFGKPYLNNGVAFAIAYAMYKRVKVLKLYGADFSYPNRDFAESGRGCVEAWITMASFHGMQIGLSPSTSLMDTVKDNAIYGYHEQPAIRMRDGRIFQYKKLDGSQHGRYKEIMPDGAEAVHHTASTVANPIYVPEDSSGNKGVHAQVSGGQRQPAGHPDRGSRLSLVAQATDSGPGARVRRRGSRRAKAAAPQPAGNGADYGPVERQAEAPVLLHAELPQRGQPGSP